MSGPQRPTKKPIVSFEIFDVVVVPFPFTDRSTTKRRPALVLSDARNFNQQVGRSVLAMITSTKNSDWPLDLEIKDLDSAGLPSARAPTNSLFQKHAISCLIVFVPACRKLRSCAYSMHHANCQNAGRCLNQGRKKVLSILHDCMTLILPILVENHT